MQIQDRIRHAFGVLQLQNSVRSVRAGQKARSPSSGARAYAVCHTQKRSPDVGSEGGPICPELSSIGNHGPTVTYAWGEKTVSVRAGPVGHQSGHQSSLAGPGRLDPQDRATSSHVRPHTAKPFRIHAQMQQEVQHGYRKVRHLQSCLIT
jgi:hypothetical protein